MARGRIRGFGPPGGESANRYPSTSYAAALTDDRTAAPLSGDAACRFCVIGGGFTGLGATLALARAGHEVRLVEAGPIGWGASGRNGGQVHVGWNKDQPWFERHLGEDRAQALWRVALAARRHLDGLLALDPARCAFRAGQVHADHKPGLVAASHDHVRHMREHYGHDTLSALDEAQIRTMIASPRYFGGSLDMAGGHLDPLRLARTMAQAAREAGAILHEQSPVHALTRQGNHWLVESTQGTIRCQRVLVATGGYGKGLVPSADAHILPINNFIATTAPLDPDLAAQLIRGGHSVSDSRFVVTYFRVTSDHRLLLGGGETYGSRFPRDIAAFVRPHLARVFPQLAECPIDHAWGGTLAITPHRLPYGAEPEPGLYVLGGYSGLGVVLAPYLGAVTGLAMAGRDGLSSSEAEALDCLRLLPTPRFPGGTWLRWPTQVAAMSFFALRDRL